MADATRPETRTRGQARGWSALAADPRALARLIEDAPFAAWLVDVTPEREYRCVAANAASAAAIGRSPIELLGRPVRENVDAEAFAEFALRVEEVIAGRRPLEYAGDIVVDDGTRRFHHTVSPVTDEHGDVTHVFGMSRDVTDEVGALRESSERFQAVFAAAHDATFLVSPDGTFLDANPAAEELLGLRHDEILERKGADFLASDRDVPGGLARLAQHPHDTPASGNLEIRRDDGTTRTTEFHAVADVMPGLHLVMLRDVTERAEAEAALRESEERFRVLADSAPVLIWMSDAEGSCTSVNRGWLEFRGRTAEQELGSGTREGIHPDDLERCRTVFQAALVTQAPYSLTYRMHRADGEYRWLLDRGAPRFRPDGAFAGFIGACVDVTDGVEAETILRAERDHQAAVISALLDGLVECDHEGRIIAVNDRFCEMTGFGKDEAMHAEIPYPWWPPERCDELLDAAEAARRDGGRELDSMFCRKSGSRFPVAISISTVYDDSGVISFVGLVRDVTAREEAARSLQRSEARSRALMDNAADVIAILDREGRLLDASPSMANVLGDDLAAHPDRPVFDLVHPDDRERLVACFVSRTVPGPGSGLPAMFRIRRADGEWRNIEAVGNNLFDDPSVGGYVLSARDVTERRRLDEQQARADHLDAVGRLAGGIARAFDSLMTVISDSAARVLAVADPDAEPRADLEEVARAAERAGALVGQLLAFGQEQTAEPTELDLDGIVVSMEPMLRRMLGPAVGLAVGSCGGRARVHADRSQIEEVLLNLVVNARDACAPYAGQVVVKTAIVDSDDGTATVVLSVRDDGSGMDEATIDRAFEPFFTTKGPGQGTGLGLSIVHGNVTRAGGSLEVDSTPGEGTIIRVSLPALPVEEPAAPELLPAEEPPTRVPAAESFDLRS